MNPVGYPDFNDGPDIQPLKRGWISDFLQGFGYSAFNMGPDIRLLNRYQISES